MRQFKDELKQGSESSKIPKELMDYFNQSLPGDLKYVQQSDDMLIVDHEQIKMTCNVLEKENERWLNKYRKYIKTPIDTLRIMTLTQTPLAVGMSDNVECDGVRIPNSLYIRNIKDNSINEKIIRYIMPTELPSIVLTLSSSKNENELKTKLTLQKCEDIEWLTYNNFSENNSLKISMTVPSEYHSENNNINDSCQISIGIDKTRADSIDEAIIAYELYNAFINKQLLINGLDVYANNITVDKKDDKLKMIRINLKLLNALKDIENELHTHFLLSEDIDEKTIDIIIKLYVSLIKKRAYKERENYETVSFTNRFDDISETNSLKDKNSAFIASGTLTLNLLGATLDLYYATCYFNIKLKDIEEISSGEYKLTFDCTDDKCYISSKIYINKDTMLSESKDHFVKYFSDATILESIDNVID